jgi:hypothetical protein
LNARGSPLRWPYGSAFEADLAERATEITR